MSNHSTIKMKRLLQLIRQNAALIAAATLTCIVTAMPLMADSLNDKPISLPSGGESMLQSERLIDGPSPFYCAESIAHDSERFATQQDDFETALRVEIYDRPRNTWDSSIAVESDVAVNEGDSILIGLWIRGQALDDNRKPIDDRGAIAEVVFERRSEPFTKSLQYLIETDGGDQWKHYWLRLKSVGTYGPGESGISLQLGYIAQRVEVAGLQLYNFHDASLESLPTSELTYVGRQADAKWRVAAEQRIDRLRRCDVQLNLMDLDGKPASHRNVSIEQVRHSFRFGTAVNIPAYTANGDDGQRYRDAIKKHFNIATIENSLKWSAWDTHDFQQRQATNEVIRSLLSNDITVRGHVLVWPGFGNSPDWLRQLEDKPDVLRKVIAAHIREMALATRGLTRQWDVVNESFDNTDFERILGRDSIAEAFRLARQEMPGVKLYYNDYAGLARAGLPTGHKDHFVDTVKFLIENSPIDGIGIQGHFGQLLTPPYRMLDELDRYEQFGLDTLITEYDVSVRDQQLQADFTRDFLTTCFSHPSIDGIMVWGFWAGAHWRPESALFAKDWSLTPMGKQWFDLIEDRWMTKLESRSDDSGKVKFRGFKGDYVIRVDGQSYEVNAATDQSIDLRLSLGR